MTISYQFCIHTSLFFSKNICLSLSLYKINIHDANKSSPFFLNRPFLSAIFQVLGVNEVKTLDATALSEEIQKATTLELRLWPGEEMTGGNERNVTQRLGGSKKRGEIRFFEKRGFYLLRESTG